MGIIKEGSKEGEWVWCTFYTRLNIGSIPLSLFNWGFMKDCTGLGGGWTLAFFCQAKWELCDLLLPLMMVLCSYTHMNSGIRREAWWCGLEM
jgi:hypothetical protein